MRGNDPTGEKQEGSSLGASSQDQLLDTSLLPSWAPKDRLSLLHPLLPPGAAGVAVISSPDPETGKHAAGSFLHFAELQPREGKDKGKEPI